MTDQPSGDSTAASRRRFLAVGGVAATTVLGGCLGSGGTGRDGEAGTATTTEPTDAGGGTGWQSIELSAVRRDETFTVRSLDAPVVVHSFAAWCPKCERLSNQLAALAETYTILGLNTDPNEDAAKVRQYANEHDFGWRFAVAPTALTEKLVSRFGTTVVNAPSTPVLVVCEDGSATFLSGSDSTRPTIRSTAEEC